MVIGIHNVLKEKELMLYMSRALSLLNNVVAFSSELWI